MRGVAYTVFQGVKPEAMEVEVLGVLRNMNGPKGDVILVRLHGQKVEYTGVVAGMSGSPVYLDGKLAGRPRLPYRRILQRAHRGELRPSRTCWKSARWTARPPKRLQRDKALGERRRRQDCGAGRGVGASGFRSGFCELPQADRDSAGVQRILRTSGSSFRGAVCLFRNRPRHGRGVGERRQTAGATRTRLRHQRHPGARRYGHWGHLHRDLRGCAATAGLRTSAAAVRLR